MKHMVIDLETLDTAVSAVVLSIGATIFDTAEPDSITFGRHRRITSKCQQQRGRTIGADTVRWWMRQSREAQAGVLDGPVTNPEVVLNEFAADYVREGCGAIWGYGADFDCSILGSLFDTYGIQRPWSYRDVRCLRTLKHTFPNLPYDESYGVAHNALDDAICQAKWLRTILMLKTSP